MAGIYQVPPSPSLRHHTDTIFVVDKMISSCKHIHIHRTDSAAALVVSEPTYIISSNIIHRRTVHTQISQEGKIFMAIIFASRSRKKRAAFPRLFMRQDSSGSPAGLIRPTVSSDRRYISGLPSTAPPLLERTRKITHFLLLLHPSATPSARCKYQYQTLLLIYSLGSSQQARTDVAAAACAAASLLPSRC